MARQRNHAAIYARRKELAQQRGYAGLKAQTRARREGRPLRSDTGAYRSAKTRVTPAGTVTKTSTKAGIVRAVQAAADAGQRVSLIATFDSGAGPRTHRLDGRVDLPAHEPAAKVRKGAGTVTGGEADGPLGPVQIVAGAAVEAGGGGGYDAGELLAFFDMWDDVWDALYDLWDEEYFG